MKYRYIRMTFPEPLTEDQEGILGANLSALKDDTVKKLDKILHETEHGIFFKGARMILMNAAAITAMQTLIRHLLFNIQTYIFFAKEAPNVVTFYYARDELALIKFKQVRFANPIQELFVLDGLKRFVFPDMKVDSSKVLLERGDIEKL